MAKNAKADESILTLQPQMVSLLEQHTFMDYCKV